MNIDNAINKSKFLSYVYHMIKEHPEWGGEVIQVITGGMNAKIHELKSQIGISQMAGMSGVAFLIGKQKATKRMVDLHEHILLKSMLKVDGIGEKPVDDAIKHHCNFMKEWIDDLHVKLHEDDEKS